MLLKNAVVNNKKCDILIENKTIKQVADNISGDGVDLKGKTVIPGLIDIHTHGILGFDTMDGSLEEISIELAKRGTTSFLPTTMTESTEKLLLLNNKSLSVSGANIIGFHFEGPFISKNHKGAQDEKNIKMPNYNWLKQFKNVKMITLAPELDRANELINKIKDDIVVCIGHTDCDKDTALLAIKNGAKCLTHIYNAMLEFDHRNPGPIGAAVEENIYAQIICDGLHIDKSVVLATYKTFGADKLILISDSIRPAYMPDGKYNCGGLEVTMKNNEARLEDGTIAGSTKSLFDCVKKAQEFGIPFSDAVKMASETPAKLLGIKKGKIEHSYDADLVVLDKNNNIENVIIRGEFIK